MFTKTRHLLNKYCNIQLELCVLLLTLCSLWLLSDDYLEFNVKLVACGVRFFIYAFKYWKNKIMFMVLVVGNLLIMIIPSISIPIPICLQTALCLILMQFIEDSLCYLFHETLIPNWGYPIFLMPFMLGMIILFFFPKRKRNKTKRIVQKILEILFLNVVIVIFDLRSGNFIFS